MTMRNKFEDESYYSYPQKSHLTPEDIERAEGWVESAEIRVERAEQVKDILKKRKDTVEYDILEQETLAQARKFREIIFPPSPAAKSLPSKFVEEKKFPSPLKKSASELHVLTEELDINIEMAEYFNETAELAIRDKVSPPPAVQKITEAVRVNESKLTNLRTFSQQSKVFLQSLPRDYLTRGE